MSIRIFLLLLFLSGLSSSIFPKEVDLKIPQETNIVWFGEVHGTATNNSVAYSFMKQMAESEAGLDYFLIEASYVTELLLNKYLESGTDSSLQALMNSYKGSIGYTVEKMEFYKDIYQLNQSLKPQDRFKAVCLDVENAPVKSHRYIAKEVQKLAPIDSTLLISKVAESKTWDELVVYYADLNAEIESKNESYKSLFGGQFDELTYLIRNVHYVMLAYNSDSWDRTRDSLIYENFKVRTREFEFEKNRSFAFWGWTHTSQSTLSNGLNYIASRIKTNRPDIVQHTYYGLYLKSAFLFSGFEAPGVIRWMFKKEKGEYRIAKRMMNSNKIIFSVSGSKYLKKIATQDVELFAMDTLPESEKFIAGKKKETPNTAYAQYVVLIQNSKALTSLEVEE